MRKPRSVDRMLWRFAGLLKAGLSISHTVQSLGGMTDSYVRAYGPDFGRRSNVQIAAITTSPTHRLPPLSGLPEHSQSASHGLRHGLGSVASDEA